MRASARIVSSVDRPRGTGMSAARTPGIRVLDHVVVAGGGFASIREVARALVLAGLGSPEGVTETNLI